MNGDPSITAFARIDAALARIEAAVARPRLADSSSDLMQLQGKHDRLRAAVQDTLTQLDHLIEGAQG